MVGKGVFIFVFLSFFLVLETNGDTANLIEFIETNKCDEIIYHPSVYPIMSILDVILRPLELWEMIKDLDLRETNLYKTAHNLRYWPYFPYFHSPLIVKDLLDLGGYYEYMNIYQESGDVEYIFNTERKGSVEEYVVYMADELVKYLESTADSCKPNNPKFGQPADKYIDLLNKRIYNIGEENETSLHITQNDYKQFTDLLDVPFHSFVVQQFFVYGSNEWAADKLATNLNDLAFYSDNVKEYVKSRLPGGDSPITFIFKHLKVLQSPKIEPVLRMAMARYVAENENFDKDFFKVLGCFLYYSAPLFGQKGNAVELFLNQLNRTYEESLIVKESGMIRNPEIWIDFMDHVLVELERIDVDKVLYDVYAIILKFRLFLVRLDYDGQMSLNMDRLWALFEKNKFIFTCGISPEMVGAAKSILSNLKSVQFWDSINSSFKEFVNNNFQSLLLPSFIIDSIQTTLNTVSEELGVHKNMTDFFETKLTDSEHSWRGLRRYFKVTNYLKSHQKTNMYSILQPNLGEIDLSYLLKSLVLSVESTVPNVVNDFGPVARKLYEDIELTLIDYGIVKNSMDLFGNFTTEIIKRVQITE